MSHKLKMHETMWAEMHPDVYDGPNCDQVRPDWEVGAEGDKCSPSSHGDQLELSAKTFPPGTTVVVSVPMCPNCSEPADYYFNHLDGTMDKCQCGFDWNDWVQNEYS